MKDIEPTGRIVLRCGCGERVVLLGSREDWLSEGRASFECGGCGSELPLPNEGDEKEQENDEPGDADPRGLSIGEYVRTFRTKKTG